MPVRAEPTRRSLRASPTAGPSGAPAGLGRGSREGRPAFYRAQGRPEARWQAAIPTSGPQNLRPGGPSREKNLELGAGYFDFARCFPLENVRFSSSDVS